MHGYWCNTKTIPMNCKLCGEQVFFMLCNCGSRVFFDDLGPPWPGHACYNKKVIETGLGDRMERADGRVSWPTLRDISFSIEDPKTEGLMPGMVRSTEISLDREILRRAKELYKKPLPRQTVAIHPSERGNSRETVVGQVQNVSKVDLTRRYKIDKGTIGETIISQKFGSSSPLQITLRVDTRLEDLEDDESYTFLINPEILEKVPGKNSLILVVMESEVVRGTSVWRAVSVELIA